MKGNAVMAFVVNAFPVFDQQNLGRFVVNREIVGHLVRYGSEAQQVEQVEIGGCGHFGPLKPVKRHAADRTAGTVFEDYLGALAGEFPDLVDLVQVVEFDPVHQVVKA